ncbi:MAG: hypothetical protein R3E84_17980 [Pseudomonadales bacterium]
MRLFAAAVLSALAGLAAAADDRDLHADVEIGYRTLSLDGDAGKYDQHVNLHSGLRLTGASLRYTPGAGDSWWLDELDVSAAGLGGDPFQDIRLDLRKFGSHRLRYQHTRADYVYADVFTDPGAVSASASNGGDFHHFDYQRTHDQLDLEVRPGERLRLLLGVDRYRRDGDSTTVLDLSREEFHLDKPADETSRALHVGVEYRWDAAVLTLDQRWRRADNDVRMQLAEPSEGSDPAALTRLDDYLLRQDLAYDSRESRVALLVRPGKRWDVRAEILRAEMALDFDTRETTDGVDFAGQPLPVSSRGDGGADRDILRLDVRGGVALTDTLRLEASVRDSQVDQDADLVLDAALDATDWRTRTRRFGLAGEWRPSRAWSLRATWNSDRRRVRDRQSVTALPARVNTDEDGFLVALAYRPGNGLSVRLSAERSSIDDPFVLASATDRRRLKASLGYRWSNGLDASIAHAVTHRDNADADWETRSRQTTLRLGWATNRFSLGAGATLIGLDVDADRRVTAGSRRVLFLIDEEARADLYDISARLRLSPALNLSGSYRFYDNDGTREARRRDGRLELAWKPVDALGLSLRYRNVDFSEDFERFDAHLVELGVRFLY